MPDDHDWIAPTCERGSDVLDGRSRREPIVRLGFHVQRSGKLATCFSRPQEGARENRLRRCQLVAHALPELPRLLSALRRQRPELVRLARRGLRVADEVEAHRR